MSGDYMGISVNVAYVFLFFSIILIVAGGVDVMEAKRDVQVAKGDYYLHEGDVLRTEFSIISSNTTPDPAPYTLTLNVKNTGSTAFNPNNLTVLVDGVVRDYTSAGGVWSPAETITITVAGLPSSPTRAVVVASNGVSTTSDV